MFISNTIISKLTYFNLGIAHEKCVILYKV